MMRSYQHGILPAFGLYTLALVAIISCLASTSQAQERIEPQDSAISESGEFVAIQDALAAIESDQGAYGSAIPEQLLSLGLMLQQGGQHAQALTTFKRGVHLTRINEGLYSKEQIPFIQGEIQSYLVLGELDVADERQAYLLKVQMRSMPSGDAFIQAIMEQADWQLVAYGLEIGGAKASYGHLQTMKNLYHMAIQDILQYEKSTSHKLLPPLHGLLRTQYLLSSYDAKNQGNAQPATDLKIQFNRYQGGIFKMGISIIKSIQQVELNTHGQNSLQVVKALVMVGDWNLWNNKRDGAHLAYLDALQELTTLDDAELQTEHLFGAPVPLPDIDGIRSMPPSVEPDEGMVLLEFGVDEHGRVFQITRLDEVETDEETVKDLMKIIRRTKFRPRYDGLEPVITEKILRGYEIY